MVGAVEISLNPGWLIGILIMALLKSLYNWVLEPQTTSLKWMEMVKQPFPVKRFGIIQLKQPFIYMVVWGSRLSCFF